MPQIGLESTSTPLLPSGGISEVVDGDWDLLGGIDKLDRIIGNIRGLVGELSALKNGQSGAPVPIVNNGGRAAITRDEHFAARENKSRETPYNNVSEERNNQNMQAALIVKAVVGQHLEKCAAENPKMPLLEVLEKTELNAEQLLVLFKQIGG